MTITERNQKLYDLRKKLDQKRMELAWIETEIMAVNSQYDRENRETPLFDEMFGGWWWKLQQQLIQFKLQDRADTHLF